MSEFAAPPPPSEPATPSQKGFFARLFDFKFETYVTPTVVSVLYGLGTVGIALAYITYVVIAFDANAALGVLVLLVVGPLMSLLALIWLRVTLEFYLALVRLSGDFREWREEWRRRLPQ